MWHVKFTDKHVHVALTHSSEAAHVIEPFRTLYLIHLIDAITMMSWSVPAILYVV